MNFINFAIIIVIFLTLIFIIIKFIAFKLFKDLALLLQYTFLIPLQLIYSNVIYTIK